MSTTLEMVWRREVPLSVVQEPTAPYGTQGTESCAEQVKNEFPFREELLQFIWQEQLLAMKGLRTHEGHPIQVVRAGHIQHDSGPDLRDALVRFDGQLWAGPVEVHCRASEWFAHGHQDDPAYDNVILHVVFENDAQVTTTTGRPVPTVALRDHIQHSALDTYYHLMKTREDVPCSRMVHRLDRERIDPWLETMLLERLLRRSGEMMDLLSRCGGDVNETFHRVLARSFGGKVNRDAFFRLAEYIPLRILWKYHDDLFRLEALLFGQAGMLETTFNDEYPLALQAEYRHLAGVHALSPMRSSAWKLARMRPAGAPCVRIAQWASVLHASGGALTNFLEVGDASALRDLLAVQASRYWNTHHHFDKVGTCGPKYMGPSAVDGLMINAVVPMQLALSRHLGKATYRERAFDLLRSIPPEKNTILREWQRHGVPARNAGEGQALIELHGNYCGHKKCLFCAIGAQLMGNGSMLRTS